MTQGIAQLSIVIFPNASLAVVKNGACVVVSADTAAAVRPVPSRWAWMMVC